MPKSIWGIDIGSSSIKAVKAELFDGNLTITDSAFMPIALDEEGKVDGSAEKVNDALRMMVGDKQLEGASCAISISGRNVFSKYFNLPPVDNVDELIPLEAKMQIPFPLEEVVWDYHNFGMNEETLETDVAIFAVKRDVINGILEQCSALKLDVVLIQSSAFSLLNYGVYEFGLEKPLVMLEGGAKNIDVIICDNGNFWPRSLPLNGTTFTKTLQSKFQIPYDEAEKLKVNLLESGQSDRIFKVIEPTLKELLGEFQRSIGFYRSQRKELNIDKILLSGNALKIPGIPEYMTTGMSKETSYLSSPSKVEVIENEEDVTLTSNFGSFIVAIGLAAQGLGLGLVKTNFVPKDLLIEKMLKKKRVYIVGALILLAVALGLGWMDASSKKSQLNSIKKLASENSSQFDSERSRYDSDVAAYKRVSAELKSYEIYGTRSSGKMLLVNKVLTEAAKTLGEKNIWFSSIQTAQESRKDLYKGVRDVPKEVLSDKDPVYHVYLEGMTQNLDDKGHELLKEFHKALEEVVIDGHKVVVRAVETTSSQPDPKVQVVKRPNLALRKDDIDQTDVLGREKFDQTVERIEKDITDIKTNFFVFKSNFYVDFAVLKLEKPKAKEEKK